MPFLTHLEPRHNRAGAEPLELLHPAYVRSLGRPLSASSDVRLFVAEGMFCMVCRFCLCFARGRPKLRSLETTAMSRMTECNASLLVVWLSWIVADSSGVSLTVASKTCTHEKSYRQILEEARSDFRALGVEQDPGQSAPHNALRAATAPAVSSQPSLATGLSGRCLEASRTRPTVAPWPWPGLRRRHVQGSRCCTS